MFGSRQDNAGVSKGHPAKIFVGGKKSRLLDGHVCARKRRLHNTDKTSIVTRYVHGNGIPNGTGNPMGMGIKHIIGNGKPPQWEWELPALPWEFIPKGFMLR